MQLTATCSMRRTQSTRPARPSSKFDGRGRSAIELAKRMTFHVLEAPDPATAASGDAQTNHVDMIVGARAKLLLRRFLGSVSWRVVAEAPCM